MFGLVRSSHAKRARMLKFHIPFLKLGGADAKIISHRWRSSQIAVEEFGSLVDFGSPHPLQRGFLLFSRDAKITKNYDNIRGDITADIIIKVKICLYRGQTDYTWVHWS